MTAADDFPRMGIAHIDAEHAGLLNCLNRLQHYAANGHGFAASIDAIQTLLTYAADHFAHEEAYLRQRGFPKLAEHIQQHEAISVYVTKLYERVLAGDEIEVPLIEMMRDWIVNHIGIEDMEFATYFGTSEPSAASGLDTPA